MSAELHDTVETNVSPSPTRRRFLKATAGAAAAATTLKITGPPVQRAEAVPWLAVGAAAAAGAIGLDYMVGPGYVEEATTKVANYIGRRFGDRRDYSGYTGEDALHSQIVIGAYEMNLSDEKVMTGLRNNIEQSDNVAYSKGKVVVVRALNNGKDESTADSLMQDEIDAYYTGIQQNVLDHYETQLSQLIHHSKQLNAHSNIENYEAFEHGTSSNLDMGLVGALPYNWTLLDGTQRTVDVMYAASHDTTNNDVEFAVHHADPDLADASAQEIEIDNQTSKGLVTKFKDYNGYTDSDFRYSSLNSNLGHDIGYVEVVPGPNNTDISNNVGYFEASVLRNVMTDITNRRDTVKSDLSGFVNDVYSAYSAGEIDLSEVVDPVTYATELSSDNDGGAFRQAQAAQLGIPTTAATNVVITVHGDEETTFETDLYTAHEPGSGEWNVGTTYDPTAWSDPLFVTYTDENGNISMTQLETEFTIESATDQEGNAIDSFGNRTTNLQSADVQALKEELERLREEQIRLQEMAEENTSGGGGSSGGSGALEWFSKDTLINGVPNAVPVIGGGALGYGLLSGGN